MRDLNVCTSLSGDFDRGPRRRRPGAVLPTDTQKNTVFAFAKRVGIGEIEEFGLALARHFVDDVAGGDRRQMRIEQYGWERIAGRDHALCRRGPDVRTTHGRRDGAGAGRRSSAASGTWWC